MLTTARSWFCIAANRTGLAALVALGCLLLAASEIGESITDWRRRKRTRGERSHN